MMATRRAGHLLALATAIGTLAFAMRPAITALPPIFPELHAYGLSPTALALLAAIPVVCFAVFSTIAPAISRRIGDESAIVAGAVLMVVFLYARGQQGAIGLFVGTVVVSAAIAVMSTLLPGLVKRRSPRHTGRLLTVYLVLLYIGAAAGSALSIPVLKVVGSLETAISAWSLSAVAALLLWIPQLWLKPSGYRPQPQRRVRILSHPVAWQITGFMGFQSLTYYATISWLPTLLRDRGLSPDNAGQAVALLSIGGLLAALVVPVAAERLAKQKSIVIATSAAAAAAIVGAGWAPLSTASMWCLLLGCAQGAALALAFHFVIARAATPEIAASVSAMSQGLGYGIAACGPLLVAGLNEATHDWNATIVALLAAVGAQTACGLLAARKRLIGREGRSKVDRDTAPDSRQPISVLILGVPGSGKTTLARLLATRYGAKHFATSRILCQRAEESRHLSQRWKVFWARGENAPDNEVLPVLWNEFAAMKDGIVILDGYPRTAAQLNDFYERGGTVTRVVHLQVREDVALGRTAGPREERGIDVSDSTARVRIAREADEVAVMLADERIRGITDTFDTGSIEPQEIADAVMAHLSEALPRSGDQSQIHP